MFTRPDNMAEAQPEAFDSAERLLEALAREADEEAEAVQEREKREP